MLNIKGFITNKRLTDNRSGSVATFGELSVYARTFSKDITEYSDVRWQNVELQVFSCKDETLQTVAPATRFTDFILEVSKWIQDNVAQNPASMTKADFIAGFLNQFYGRLRDVNAGTVVTSGIYVLPEWVSFVKIDAGVPVNTIKLWLNNTALERDYDEYSITIVPPLPNLDSLFRPLSDVQTLLTNYGIGSVMDSIATAKGKLPETQLRVQTFPLLSQSSTATIDTNWYAIINGPKGDNPDNIRAELIRYILANSSETEAQWKLVMPDLFRSTQMYVLPRWTKMAIPNRTDLIGIYSPLTNVKEDLNIAKTTFSGLTSAHIEANLEITHHKWRSLSLLVVGSTDNKGAKYKLSDYYSDYIAELSTSQDFNRQAVATQRWSLMMENMLQLAETDSDASALPANIQRTTKFGISWLTQKLDGVQWMVATKSTSVA